MTQQTYLILSNCLNFQKNVSLDVSWNLLLIIMCISRTNKLFILKQESEFNITPPLSLLEDKLKMFSELFIKFLFCGLLLMYKLLHNYLELMYGKNNNRKSNTCILEERTRKYFGLY